MKIAIIGIPQAGKTGLFSLMTGISYNESVSVQSAGKFKSGMVRMVDERLSTLHQKCGPEKKLIFTSMEIKDTDPVTLTSPDRKKNNEILSLLREMDGIIHVVRAYQDDSGTIGPSVKTVIKEIEDVKAELFLSDLDIMEKRISKLEHQLTRPIPTAQQDKKELEVLKKLKDTLTEGGTFRSLNLNAETLKLLSGYGFLSLKPLILILNIVEINLDKIDKFAEINARYPYSVIICIKLEQDLGQLPEDEKQTFMKDYGLKELVTPQITKTCYHALGLRSFFTIGKNEVRAWTIKDGDNAVTAAGKVHTDMARGFISAEVVSFQDWQAAGSMKSAKEHGKVRLEGKNYIVNDGDVINFKFNV